MTRGINTAQPEPPDPAGGIPVRIVAPEEFIGGVLTALHADDGFITKMHAGKHMITVSTVLPAGNYDSFVKAVVEVTRGKGYCNKIELLG
jgi:hypothetical protein